MRKIQAIVLSAGRSRRFRTGKTKLAEKICGQEMVLYSVKLLDALQIPTTFVVGYRRTQVQALITANSNQSPTFVVQTTPQGTGHAVLCARDQLTRDHVLIMNADAPLVTEEIITHLYETHTGSDAAITFVIAHNSDTSQGAYGRIVKEENQIAIVEAHEFTGDASEDCCINAGIYLVRRDFLEKSIGTLDANATTNEFYLTDLVKIASKQGLLIRTVTVPFDRVRGVNTFKELWVAEQIKRADLIAHWMERGVYFVVPQSVHIDIGVTIGAGTKIGAGVQLRGTTSIGQNCNVDAFCVLENSTIADDVTIHSHSVTNKVTLKEKAVIGPFAHLHSQTHINAHARIGNFVEVKKSTIGEHTNAKHHSYLGDAQIGKHVNIGAGTITCNYDGKKKHKTIIEDRAFIGSNSSLIAPVTIGRDATVAAGSVITDDVPEHALGIARQRQVTKEDYNTPRQPRANNNSFIAAVKTSNDSSMTENR